MPLALHPETPASCQNLADPLADSLFLFVPFYFSMSFQSSRISSIILRPNPLRQAVSPFFAYFLPNFFSPAKPLISPFLPHPASFYGNPASRLSHGLTPHRASVSLSSKSCISGSP